MVCNICGPASNCPSVPFRDFNRRSPSTFLICLVCLVGAVASGQIHSPLSLASDESHGDERVLHTFLMEAPAAWKAAVDRMSLGFNAIHKWNATFFKEGQQYRKVEVHSVVKWCEPLQLVETRYAEATAESEKVTETVDAKNKSYGFRLMRNEHGGWQVRHLSKDKLESVNEILQGEGMGLLKMPFLCGNRYLSEIFQEGRSELLGVTSSDDRGHALVRIDFIVLPSDDKWECIARRGWIRLDPQLGWAIWDYNVETRDGRTLTGKHEYDGILEGVPLLSGRNIQYVKGRSETSKTLSWQDHLEGLSLVASPDKDFTLSAYGFSEPRFNLSRRKSAALIALNVAVIIGLAAWIAARRGMKKGTT